MLPVGLHHFQQLVRFLNGLLHRDGGGEEIGPHVQPRVDGPLHVGVEIGVLKDLGGAVLPIQPVARPDDGKVDAVRRHRGPVDVPLVAGHVDAAGEVAAGVGNPTGLLIPDKLLRDKGDGGHRIQHVQPVVVPEAEHPLAHVHVHHPPHDGGQLLPGDGFSRLEGAAAVFIEEAVHDPLLEQLGDVAVVAVVIGALP